MADGIDLTSATLATASELPEVEIYAQKQGTPITPRRVSVAMLLSFIAAAANGYGRYATTALRVADTTKPAGYLAYVYANNGSPTDSENGFWQATGVSGTPWTRASWISNDLIAVVQPYATSAQAWAESATAPGTAGTKSSKTWASEASTSAIAAAASASAAAAALYAATLLPGQGGGGATTQERAAFARLGRFELFGGPTNKVPMLEMLAWKDVGNRFICHGGFADDANGTNYARAFTVTVADASAYVEARRELALSATGSTYTGVTGVIEFDFSDSTAVSLNSTPTTSAKWQTRVLAGRVRRTNAARTADITAIAGTAIAANSTVAWTNKASRQFVTMPTSSSSTVEQGLLSMLGLAILPQYRAALLGKTLFVRESGGDITAGPLGRHRFRVATWDGTTALTFGTEQGNGTFATVTGFTGIRWLPLVAIAGNVFGVATGTIIGYYRYDFLAGGGIGTYAGTIGVAAGTLEFEAVFVDQATVGAIDAAIVAAAAAAATKGKLLLASASDDYLRALLYDGKIMGMDPDDKPFLTYETQYYPALPTLPVYRAWFYLNSTKHGAVVGQWKYESGTDPLTYLKANNPMVRLTHMADGNPISGLVDRGIEAHFKVDWDKVQWTKSLASKTVAQTGIDPALIITPDELPRRATLPAAPRGERILYVGPGAPFTSVVSAFDSLEHPAAAAVRQRATYPLSQIVSPAYPATIQMVGPVNEQITPFLALGIWQSPIRMMAGLTFKTRADTRLWMADAGLGASVSPPVAEYNQGGRIDGEGLFEQFGPGYVFHIDAGGNLCTLDAGGVLRRYIPTYIGNIMLKRASNTNVGLIGFGIADGQHILCDGTRLYMPDNAGGAPFISGHNNPGNNVPGLLHLRNVSTNQSDYPTTIPVRLVKSNTNANLVRHGICIEDSDIVPLVGSSDPAINYANSTGEPGKVAWKRVGAKGAATWHSDLSPW